MRTIASGWASASTLSVLVVMMAGCAPWGAASDDPAWPSGQVASSLEVGIAASEVRFVLHVTNVTESPVDFTFPTSQRYDFMVDDGAGQEVWRWSADRAFTQVVTHARLEAGETWTMEAAWTTDQESGTYIATGRLTAMDRPVEQRAAFELP
jgi:hypothetical protein